MSETVNWEYHVEKLGNWLGAKPEEVTAALNAWGMEGWEVINFFQAADGPIWVIAKRSLAAGSRPRSTSLNNY